MNRSTLNYDADSLARAIVSALAGGMMDPVIAAYVDEDGDVTFLHESALVPSDATAAIEWDLSGYGVTADYYNEDGEIEDPATLANDIARMCTEDPQVWLSWVENREEA